MINRRNFLGASMSFLGGILLGKTPEIKAEKPTSLPVDPEIKAEKPTSLPVDPDRFPFGLWDIDQQLCGGLRRGDIGIVTGLCGSGQTSVLVNAALTNVKQGKKVLIIAYEPDVLHRLARWGNCAIWTLQQHGIKCNHPIRQLCIQSNALPNLMVAQAEWGHLEDFFSDYANVIKGMHYHDQGFHAWKPDLVIVDGLWGLPSRRIDNHYDVVQGGLYDYWVYRCRLVDILANFVYDENQCLLMSKSYNRRSYSEDLTTESLISVSMSGMRIASAVLRLSHMGYQCSLPGKAAIEATLIKNRYGSSVSSCFHISGDGITPALI